MKTRAWWAFLAAGGAVLAWRGSQRTQPAYPAPESLVIDLETDLLPHEGGNRHIPLDGGANLRDIGGYRTTDGRYVRWGQVYRSGTLAGLNDSDMVTLSGLGLQVVCDLRSDTEVQDTPDRLPAHTRYVRAPVNADRRGDRRARLWALLFDKQRLMTMIPEIYRRVIDDHADAFGIVLRQLADPANLPALFHCTAGKDRAGLTAALLLLVLGVPEDVVIADYSLSNRHYAFYARYTQHYVRRLAVFGVTSADMYPLLTADPQTLKGALGYMVEKYGSVTAYLRDRAGVDEPTLERIKANLLT